MSLVLKCRHPYQIRMLPSRWFATCFVCFATVTIAAEKLELRPLKPIVTELSQAEKPDVSELAYANARAAAVCGAISLYFSENAQREQDRKLSDDYRSKAVGLLEAAIILGQIAGKSRDATRDQVGGLIRIYAERIVASKQLNNEILSPAIREDLEATVELQKSMPKIFQKLELSLSNEKK